MQKEKWTTRDCNIIAPAGQQQSSSSSSAHVTTAAADHNTATSLQIKPSVANTKFPRGVYPQRESNQSLPITAGSKDDSHHDHVQPFRLKLGVVTSSDPHLYASHDPIHDNDKLEESTAAAVVQIHPTATTGEDHINIKEQEAGKIPEELDWLLKKGVTGAQMHTAATVIQK